MGDHAVLFIKGLVFWDWAHYPPCPVSKQHLSRRIRPSLQLLVFWDWIHYPPCPMGKWYLSRKIRPRLDLSQDLRTQVPSLSPLSLPISASPHFLSGPSAWPCSLCDSADTPASIPTPKECNSQFLRKLTLHRVAQHSTYPSHSAKHHPSGNNGMVMYIQYGGQFYISYTLDLYSDLICWRRYSWNHGLLFMTKLVLFNVTNKKPFESTSPKV